MVFMGYYVLLTRSEKQLILAFRSEYTGTQYHEARTVKGMMGSCNTGALSREGTLSLIQKWTEFPVILLLSSGIFWKYE
jgi:hypothetical protein